MAQNTERRESGMTDEAICKVAKEIVVKFIEVGKVSPANFAGAFQEVYEAVKMTVRK